jgi:hypothetical protein
MASDVPGGDCECIHVQAMQQALLQPKSAFSSGLARMLGTACLDSRSQHDVQLTTMSLCSYNQLVCCAWQTKCAIHAPNGLQ